MLALPVNTVLRFIYDFKGTNVLRHMKLMDILKILQDPPDNIKIYEFFNKANELDGLLFLTFERELNRVWITTILRSSHLLEDIARITKETCQGLEIVSYRYSSTKGKEGRIVKHNAIHFEKVARKLHHNKH